MDPSPTLLDSYLKELRLPTMLRHYRQVAEDAAQANLPYDRFLLALVEQEVAQREHNRQQQRVKAARFPVLKELADFDFSCLTSPTSAQVLRLAQGDYIRQAEPILLVGHPGLGKTHLATALALTAARQGFKVRFYTADGLLWLASGEADVWALWEGGIRNATCLFDGEARKMPSWLVPELAQLGVREVHLAPDRDRAGMRWVINISRALSRSSIRVIMHKLPFPPRSKGDVGRLLVEVGSARLKPTLGALPAFKATFVPSDAGHKPAFIQLRLPNLFSNHDDLYERWAVEVVEEAAIRTWAISPPARKGFSMNFLCPFHEDRRPSAGWSYRTHGIHCFACGYHTTQEVADLLGVPSWEAFRAEHSTVQNIRYQISRQ
jgi:hypothetical protein